MSSPGSKKRRPQDQALANLTKEELFAKLQASAERTLWALEQAYDTGLQEGFEGDEEDQLIELLRRAKHLREDVKRITQEHPS